MAKNDSLPATRRLGGPWSPHDAFACRSRRQRGPRVNGGNEKCKRRFGGPAAEVSWVTSTTTGAAHVSTKSLATARSRARAAKRRLKRARAQLKVARKAVKTAKTCIQAGPQVGKSGAVRVGTGRIRHEGKKSDRLAAETRRLRETCQAGDETALNVASKKGRDTTGQACPYQKSSHSRSQTRASPGSHCEDPDRITLAHEKR